MSLEETAAKIKQEREQQEEDADQEREVTDAELFEWLRKHVLHERGAKVKLLVDLIKDGADRFEAFCAATGTIPRRILWLNCTLKSFEEEEEGEDKEARAHELEKLRTLHDE